MLKKVQNILLVEEEEKLKINSASQSPYRTESQGLLNSQEIKEEGPNYLPKTN